MKTLAIYGVHGAVTDELAIQADGYCHVLKCSSETTFAQAEADFYLGLSEINNAGWNEVRKLLYHAPAKKLPGKKSLARFCAWDTLWQRKTWEIAVAHDTDKTWVSELLELVQRKPMFVQDSPGLIAPRILACLINEAGLALNDGICSGQDLDTAMQLGTGYPLGLLAWRSKIGAEEIEALLQALGREHPRNQQQAHWK